jgi:hypothetical protein
LEGIFFRRSLNECFIFLNGGIRIIPIEFANEKKNITVSSKTLTGNKASDIMSLPRVNEADGSPKNLRDEKEGKGERVQQVWGCGCVLPYGGEEGGWIFFLNCEGNIRENRRLSFSSFFLFI